MTRAFILIAISISTVVLIALLNPIPQDLDYHRFVDTRSLAEIPNFLNVFSNLPYLLIGALGFQLFSTKYSIQPGLSWGVFFLGVFLVGIGSSYYHLNPNNATLVWDRLPMTIGFMGLFVALLSEWISVKLKILLLPMCLLGIYSVYYWHNTDDLRLYAWVQFFPLLFILLVGILFRPNIPHVKYIYIGLGFYILSKLFEHFDIYVHTLTNFIISGHTLKHFAAAYATYCIYLMLLQRATHS